MAHKILLIDDDPLVRQSVRLLLQKNGYSVSAVQSVSSALDLSQTEQFDLVVSDIRMPDIDGVTGAASLSKLVKEKWGKDIPVIFITGYGGVEKELSAEILGETIAKPFDINFLLATIRDYL